MPCCSSNSLPRDSQAGNQRWSPDTRVGVVATSDTTNGNDTKAVVEDVIVAATIMEVGAAAMVTTPRRARQHSHIIQTARLRNGDEGNVQPTITPASADEVCGKSACTLMSSFPRAASNSKAPGRRRVPFELGPKTPAKIMQSSQDMCSATPPAVKGSPALCAEHKVIVL